MDEDVINIDENEYPPGKSDPDIIPESTYWPVTLAFGITLLFWGFITSLFISAAGLVCVIAALAGWIKELNNEK